MSAKVLFNTVSTILPVIFFMHIYQEVKPNTLKGFMLMDDVLHGPGTNKIPSGDCDSVDVQQVQMCYILQFVKFPLDFVV